MSFLFVTWNKYYTIKNKILASTAVMEFKFIDINTYVLKGCKFNNGWIPKDRNALFYEGRKENYFHSIDLH